MSAKNRDARTFAKRESERIAWEKRMKNPTGTSKYAMKKAGKIPENVAVKNQITPNWDWEPTPSARPTLVTSPLFRSQNWWWA